jgi:hypothetical protein
VRYGDKGVTAAPQFLTICENRAKPHKNSAIAVVLIFSEWQVQLTIWIVDLRIRPAFWGFRG